jgi:hypothetical protein
LNLCGLMFDRERFQGDFRANTGHISQSNTYPRHIAT